jgi:hypothetical protein
MNEKRTMLFRKELIEALAETLEGIILPSSGATAKGSEQTIVLFHTRDLAEQQSQPILEIVLSESEQPCVVIHSALGVMEFREVEEVRLSPSTEEAAFFMRSSASTVSVVTVSSRGVLQVYQNVPARVRERELAELEESDLRAAVALKIFTEGAQIFAQELQHSN